MQRQTSADLRSKQQYIDYLLSFDAFRGNETEGQFYVNEAIERFLITVDMVPPAPQPGARLLELGASPYYMSLLLKRAHSYEITAANYFGAFQTERTGEFEITSEEYGETHTFRYDHFNVETEEFPYDDATFDGVLFCEIIEHLTINPTHTLYEIHRVLKPGGFVIVTTPNMLRWEHVWNLLRGRNINDVYSGYGIYGRHNREYAPDEVIRLLQDCGFRVDNIRLENLHQSGTLQRVLSTARKHWKEHIFTLARSVNRRRYALPTWLYRSMVGTSATRRKVISNTVIMGENDELHVGDGWWQQEQGWRWTQKSAEIFLRAQGGERSVLADVSSGTPLLGPVTLTLRCGDRQTTVTLAASEHSCAVLEIPVCAAGEEVAVSFEVDVLRSPANKGISADTRQLGVMVKRVALQ